MAGIGVENSNGSGSVGGGRTSSSFFASGWSVNNDCWFAEESVVTVHIYIYKLY